MANQDSDNSGVQGKTKQQLKQEISETRQAIGADLRAIGDKLNPAVLKDEAREVINDAKEGAKEIIRDARDAANDSLRTAKQQAMGAVNETVGEIKDEARRVTHATTQFLGRNAVPLTLIGLGVGWLMFSRRDDSSRVTSTSPNSLYRPNDMRSPDRGTDSALNVVKSKIVNVGGQSVEAAKMIGEKAAHLTHEAAHLTHELSEGAMHQWERGRQGVVDLARENPLAVGAAVMAAGVGVGLMIPTTNWENRWMGDMRDKLLDETKGLAGELRDTTERLGRGAREALADVRQNLETRSQ